MEENALDRQLREVLHPLGVELPGPDSVNETQQETRRREVQQHSPFIEVVCLYADEDELHWVRLSEHFAVLGDDRLSLRPCKVSKEWPLLAEPLLRELEQAHVVLTLLSVDLLLVLVRSDQRVAQTLARIARYEAEAFASFSVVLRPCAWEDHQFA